MATSEQSQTLPSSSPVLTYEEADVPKWKLERFREWLLARDASDGADTLVGRAVRAPGA